MKVLRAIVHGKVQGVWFRAWTHDTAREMGVVGWVRNLASGGVEVLAQAESEVLEKFLERLHDGPPLARVTHIETAYPVLDKVFDNFEVRA